MLESIETRGIVLYNREFRDLPVHQRQGSYNQVEHAGVN